MGMKIIKGKLYISVQEVVTYLEGLRLDVETSRERCLNDVEKLATVEVARQMLTKITNMDYDYFTSLLIGVQKDLQQHVEKGVRD